LTWLRGGALAPPWLRFNAIFVPCVTAESALMWLETVARSRLTETELDKSMST